MIRRGQRAFADRWATPRIKWLYDGNRQKVYSSINTDYRIRKANLSGKTTLIFDKEFRNAKPTSQEKKDHIDKTFKSREWILKAYPNELCAIRDMKLLPKGYVAVYAIKGIESLSIDVFDENGKWREEPVDWGADPSKVVEHKEFKEVLERCLSTLPSRLNDAFSLCELDELSSKEVCKVLNVSATNLWVMLYRARVRLRRCLEMNWFGLKKARNV